jgi:hypothetical protein
VRDESPYERPISEIAGNPLGALDDAGRMPGTAHRGVPLGDEPPDQRPPDEAAGACN